MGLSEEYRPRPVLSGLALLAIASASFNPLYIGGLFHCYMLDESICHFRAVGSILALLVIFDGKSC